MTTRSSNGPCRILYREPGRRDMLVYDRLLGRFVPDAGPDIGTTFDTRHEAGHAKLALEHNNQECLTRLSLEMVEELSAVGV